MKRFLLLFLIPIVSASCIQTTTAMLANSTITLMFDSCINLTDINALIYPQDIKLDEVIEMTPTSSEKNSYTNSTYKCNPENLNQNKTMDYGDTYENEEYNIHLKCKEYEKINEIIALTAGNSRTYPDLNLTINSVPKNYNEDITIEQCGYTRNFEEIGISIKSPECINKIVTLDYNDSYQIPFFDLIIKTKDVPSQKTALQDGENWEWESIEISCITPFEKYDNFCRNRTAEFVSSTWHMVNMTNYTCKNYGYFCIDDLTDQCSYEERIGDPLGLIKCQNRVAETSENETKKYKVQLDQCNTDRNIISQNQINTTQASENMYYVLLLVVAIIFLFLGVGFFAYSWAKKKGENR